MQVARCCDSFWRHPKHPVKPTGIFSADASRTFTAVDALDVPKRGSLSNSSASEPGRVSAPVLVSMALAADFFLTVPLTAFSPLPS